VRNCEVSRHEAGAENHPSQIIVASSFIRRPDATCEEELSQFIVCIGRRRRDVGRGRKSKAAYYMELITVVSFRTALSQALSATPAGGHSDICANTISYRKNSTTAPPFVRWEIWNIHVHKVHVYEVYAHEVHAHEVHAHEVYAREMHAHEVHACEMHVYEVHTP
jgi:hypothetical protein